MLPVDRAAQARSSCRGFLDKKISEETIKTLFELSQKAPSWCNIQPWNMTILSAPHVEQLSQKLVETAQSGEPNPHVPFPGPYPEPYLSRRRACGLELYKKMGITKEDKVGRQKAWLRNYQIFDAPHLAIVSRDKNLGEYATLDVGVWLGYFLLVAESLGIATIPMASLAEYPAPIIEFLNIEPSQTILFGLAFGYKDESVVANKATTSREPLTKNIKFFGS